MILLLARKSQSALTASWKIALEMGLTSVRARCWPAAKFCQQRTTQEEYQDSPSIHSLSNSVFEAEEFERAFTLRP